MSLVVKKESQAIQQRQTLNRKRITKVPVPSKPPFYDVHDDDFYHGPAWVIKPRLFQPKENHLKKPGPGYYHIPDRSIYARPGKTIGSRHEDTPTISTHLLAHYYPNDAYISSAQIPRISVTPRRIEHIHERGYSSHFYLPSDLTDHRRAPLLRPSYGPIISRKSINHNSSSISPGPAAYPMFEFDEDILPRPQPGFTQKHRFPSDQENIATLKINPPFYYPSQADRHRFPSITIGKRLVTCKRINHSAAPYYTPFDDKRLCTSAAHPGATLKGRWSPSVYIQKKETKPMQNHPVVTEYEH